MGSARIGQPVTPAIVWTILSWIRRATAVEKAFIRIEKA
jgi:hypothetical protein